MKITVKKHTFDIKYQSPHSMKIRSQKWNILQCYEIWHWEQVKLLNHKYDIWNCRPWPGIILEQIWSENCNVLDFYEIWHSKQTEHPNYDYSTWNWLSWPKIIDSGKFDPKTEICKMFTNFDTQNYLNILLFIRYLEFKTWPKILDLGRFGSAFQIWSYIYDVWSEQTECANFEYTIWNRWSCPKFWSPSKNALRNFRSWLSKFKKFGTKKK